ncbi:MAG: histidine kinase [Dehalococcoidales bacterium]
MAFRNKLQYRIILLVFGVLLVIGVVGGVVILQLQQQSTVSHFTKLTTALATALRDSLERDMLLVERERVQQSVVLMASMNFINDVTIISSDQRIYASAEPSVIGEIRDDEEIIQILASGETVTKVENRYGYDNLYVLFPVWNKPDCHRCHGSELKILGAIEIGVDSSPMNEQIKEQTLIMLVIAGITFTFMGGGLVFVFRSAVVKPMSGLVTSARRIARGDLSARVEVRRDDEVGVVARSFNEMAEQVEQHALALEDSKKELEQRVQERTQQLEKIVGVRGQLLEKLISAQEEERHRVARELHDEVGQALSAIMMDLARAIDGLPGEATEAKQRLLQSRSLAVQTLAELRKLIYDLRPEVLDHLGLVPALRSYIKSRLEDKNIKVRLSVSGLKGRLPSRIEVTLFRIIQETTTNVIRHSSASTVNIQVAIINSLVTVTIEDDGKGFDVEAVLQASESWGLRGIRERIAVVGGQLNIESESGQGTRIQFKIPLEGV